MRKASLNVHVSAIHEEDKKFLCFECGTSFKAASALIDHRKRVHLKVRKHRCTHCGKEFFAKKDFIDHTRVHTGERPFQCQVKTR